MLVSTHIDDTLITQKVTLNVVTLKYMDNAPYISANESKIVEPIWLEDHPSLSYRFYYENGSNGKRMGFVRYCNGEITIE